MNDLQTELTKDSDKRADAAVSAVIEITGATARIAGSDAGVIRLTCQLPPEYSGDDLRRALRLSVPGEATPLNPTDVTREGDHYSVGFMSSAVANSGKIPVDCVAGWEDDAGSWIELGHISLESERQAAAHGRGQETAHAAVGHSAAYPRTVGVAALFAIFIGIATIVLFFFLNMS